VDERLRTRYAGDDAARAYRTKYEGSPFRRWSSRREKALVARLLDRSGAEGEVLDVPCGTGRMVPTLLARAPRVVAVDLSDAMIRVATEDLAREIAAGRVAVSVASADALPFPDGVFAAAVCWRLLHHLHDRAARARVLSELARVARTAVVASFADAATWKARSERRRGRARRCAFLTADDVASEARDVGLRLAAVLRLSSPFSVQAGALLLRS
jgi:SAM-dependent methyltransferase